MGTWSGAPYPETHPGAHWLNFNQNVICPGKRGAIDRGAVRIELIEQCGRTQPSSRDSSLFGHFAEVHFASETSTGTKQQEILVSRGKVLELLRPDESGKVQSLASVECFSLIRSIVPLRPDEKRLLCLCRAAQSFPSSRLSKMQLSVAWFRR